MQKQKSINSTHTHIHTYIFLIMHLFYLYEIHILTHSLCIKTENQTFCANIYDKAVFRKYLLRCVTVSSYLFSVPIP